MERELTTLHTEIEEAEARAKLEQKNARCAEERRADAERRASTPAVKHGRGLQDALAVKHGRGLEDALVETHEVIGMLCETEGRETDAEQRVKELEARLLLTEEKLCHAELALEQNVGCDQQQSGLQKQVLSPASQQVRSPGLSTQCDLLRKLLQLSHSKAL